MGAGQTRRVIVLGSTGSVGTQTLEVIDHLNALHVRGEWDVRYEVAGLAAGSNESLLARQAERFGVRQTAIARSVDVSGPGGRSIDGADGRVRRGDDAAERLVREVECDIVVAAMSGAAGLPATLAAAELGRDIALANKETLVAAGELIVPTAMRSGSRLLPLDSEHSALWQCLAAAGRGAGDAAPPTPGLGGQKGEWEGRVRRAILTASGGPFRTWTRQQMEAATPEQALKHPTWNMGRKVTIDCASLMNKALEIVEAHWLFGLPAEKIAALIHPQSIVHAMTEFVDGAVVAQLAEPDMKLPIQHALTWPRRAVGCSRGMNWSALRKLDFEEPDLERFPSLALASRAIREGGTAGAILNAANEAAVEAFLGGRIGFMRISSLVKEAMDELGSGPLEELAGARRAEAAARAFVARRLVG